MSNRRLVLLLMCAGLVLMIVSGVVMWQRVGAYYKENKRALFVYYPLDVRECMFAGKPVKLVDESVEGVPYLDVHYGDEKLRLAVTIPGQYDLPGLAKHQDWMRLMRFVDGSGKDFRETMVDLKAGKLQDRLLIATRTPRPGSDPSTWGTVWKKYWTFDFYEFKPEGGFAHERLRYPTTRFGQKPKEGELRENTWQYQAALQLMPKDGPTYRFTDTGIQAAGWTLPGTALGGLMFIGGLLGVLSVRPASASSKPT